MDNLIKFYVIPNSILLYKGTEACVINAGHWAKDYIPPSDSASVKTLRAFKNFEVCYLAPLILKVIIPPYPLICFLAI